MGEWKWFGRNTAAVLGHIGQLAPRNSEVRKDADFLLREVEKERAEIAAEKAGRKARK